MLTYKQLSAELGVAIGTLKRWKLSGMPAHVDSGMRVWFELAKVQAWIAERRSEPNKLRRLRDVTFNREAFVYFAVRSDGPVKIGFTSDPKRRSHELNRNAVHRFTIVATIP